MGAGARGPGDRPDDDGATGCRTDRRHGPDGDPGRHRRRAGPPALRRGARAGDPRAGGPAQPRLHPLGADPGRGRLRPRDERRQHLRWPLGDRRGRDPRREPGAGLDRRPAGLARHRRRDLRQRRYHGQPLRARGRPPQRPAAAAGARPAARPGRRLGARLHRRRALVDPLRRRRDGRRGARGAGGRPRPAHGPPRCAGCSTARPAASSRWSRRRAPRTPGSSTTWPASRRPAPSAAVWLHVDGAYGGAGPGRRR